MKTIIISSINKNLTSAIELIDAIDIETYQNKTVGPYFSSIGSHLRHVLDFFDCIINGLDSNNIDLTARKRDEIISTDKEAAKAHIYKLQETIHSFSATNTDYLLHVTDNLGEGKVTVNYTLESILAHANSHAIHHYAVIGYILSFLNVELKLSSFGYNPTSPINKREGI